MKRTILLAVAALALFVNAAAFAETAAQKYPCPMHPEVVSEAPGDCPKCGMTLQPVKAEEKKAPVPKTEKKKPHAEHDLVEHEAKKLKSEARPEGHDMGQYQTTMASSLNLTAPIARESSGAR